MLSQNATTRNSLLQVSRVIAKVAAAGGEAHRQLGDGNDGDLPEKPQ